MPTLLLLVAAALLAQGTPHLDPFKGTLLLGDQAQRLLHSGCGRWARDAARVEAAWLPDRDTLFRLEATIEPLLQDAIVRARMPHTAFDAHRQYAGLIVAGRPVIFVDGVLPAEPGGRVPSDWRRLASGPRACQGGNHFGAQFDPATGELRGLTLEGRWYPDGAAEGLPAIPPIQIRW